MDAGRAHRSAALTPDAKRARNVTVPGPRDPSNWDRYYRTENCSAAAATRSLIGFIERCIEAVTLSDQRVSSER